MSGSVHTPSWGLLTSQPDPQRLQLMLQNGYLTKVCSGPISPAVGGRGELCSKEELFEGFRSWAPYQFALQRLWCGMGTWEEERPKDPF
jgi:hypothetical protein